MAAGRTAGNHEKIGVGAVLRPMSENPFDGVLEVDEMLGERGVRAEAIIGAAAHPAARGEMLHERQALLVLAADHPRASVNLQQGRAPLRCAAMPVDVEFEVEAAHPRVRDVTNALDLGMADRK